MKVFDNFDIGDVVVSTIKLGATRIIGDMFIIKDESNQSNLYYTNHGGSKCNSNDKKSFRLATPIEQYFYAQGGRNVKDMVQTNYNNYEIY